MPRLAAERDKFPTTEWELEDEFLGSWYLMRNSIIRWIDGSLVHLSIGRDISLQKQFEEKQKMQEEELRVAVDKANQASRIKSTFLANMSQQIRTPMNNILGFAELGLDDKNISERAKEYLEKIRKGGEGLLDLISEIVDMSRIETGKLELEQIPFNIHDVPVFCQKVSTPKAKQKGLTLYFYAEPAIHSRLIGDPTKLRQALLNLIDNAIKFTNSGIVKVNAIVKEESNDTVNVHFEVKDSGVGIPEEKIPHIFASFKNSDKIVSGNFSDAGLGLTITKTIIETMGGALNVESSSGLGSKFSFELVFVKAADAGSARLEESAARRGAKPFFKGEVLVAEDDEFNQEVIAEHLTRLGLKPVLAADGQKALDKVAERIDAGHSGFDLILMDIHMPGMNGLEAARKIQELGCDTPIIALTANVLASDKEKYREYGINEFLAKPFKAQELWELLLKHLDPLQVEETAAGNSAGKFAWTGGETHADPSTLVKSVIDQDHGKAVAMGDENTYRRFLINFSQSNQRTVKELNAALSASDGKQAYRIAHALRGLAETIGAIKLASLAADIEDLLEKGNIIIAKERIPVLNEAMRAVMDELDKIIGES